MDLNYDWFKTQYIKGLSHMSHLNNASINGFDHVIKTSNNLPIYQSGFTLIEAIISVLILATISSIALPSFVTAQQRWEAHKIRSDIINTFRVAKAHSFTQRTNTVMCLADIHQVCHKQAAHYLLVFSDSDDNHKFDLQADQLLLKQALNLNYGRVYLNAGRRHYIKFFGDSGLPRGHFGHIKYCPNNGNKQNMYQISINQQGNHRFKPYRFKKTGCP
ncbi:prepilin-type cleavage/methylation domain-containing protein [Psychrobacter sp. YP14]|nr:prepilin-type cleavage/methylation domain-containing protein [Psychrobacter sp. YP14]